MKPNKNDRVEMRRFGYAMAVVLPIVFGVLLPWFWNLRLPIWPWLVSVCFLILAMVVPAALRPVYIVWMKFGHAMNWLISRVALSFVFYGVVLPIGLFMRLLGNDPMSLSPARKETYRIPSEQADRKHLERPF